MNARCSRNIIQEIERRERECRKTNDNESLAEIVGILTRFYLIPTLVFALKAIFYLTMATLFVIALPAIIDSVLETYDM